MAEYTQGIYIDGQFFDVPLVSIKRSFDVLDKYAERDEDNGDLKREILGVYLNYDMAFGISTDFGKSEEECAELYDRLLNKLIEPVEFHDFVMPHQKGTFPFRGYISKVTDEVKKLGDGFSDFQNLTCKFTMKAPFLTP